MMVLWLVLLPFITIAGSYEGPKILWMWIGGFFLTAFWVYRLLGKKELRLQKTDLWLLYFIGILTIASLLGIHPLESIIGGSYRHQGILFFVTLVLISMTVSILSTSQKLWLRYAIIASILVQSILVIFQKMVFHMIRPIGTIGESNAVAGFLSIGLYFILSSRSISSLLRFLFSVCIIAGVLGTGSRTGLVCVGIILGGFSISSLTISRPNPVLFGVIIGCFISLGIAGYMHLKVITITRPVSHYENRQEFWRVGFGEFVKRPWFGYGAETLEVVYDQAYKRSSLPLVDFMIDRSHNIFLDVSLWSGILGLIVFTGWLGLSFRSLIVEKNYVKLFSFIAWIFFACLQPVGIVQWVQLILLVGVV